MKYYLLDDDHNIINILKIILRDKNLGQICGTSDTAMDALEDIAAVKPDIVIVDLLMPEMDGITFVKQAKRLCPEITFVMLSQVSSKDMISKAYEAGIEFYLQKPINAIEVEAVLKNVNSHLLMRRTFQKAQALFAMDGKGTTPATSEKKYIAKLKNVLQQLGIIGEIGSKDIITLIEYLVEHGVTVDESTLSELCAQCGDNPKSVEQRIRRAANAGMVNLAHIGLEDYTNEIFVEYSNTLYNFEQVRKEMDYIRGKSDKHGNVKIKNFLNALMLYSQN